MTRMSRAHAERIICETGWLAQTSEAFRITLLQNARLLKLKAGHTIFRPGDSAGGIYGLVSGTVIVNTAPPDTTPKLIHIAMPGGWTGEDSFMTGNPRRIELFVCSEAWVMHVPLEAMERMTASDPSNIREFGVMSILAADKLLRIVHDLQKKSVSARIASVLHRLAWTTHAPISISQENLGILASTSRKQINMTIRDFVIAGWIQTGYGKITVTNPMALQRHAEEEASD